MPQKNSDKKYREIGKIKVEVDGCNGDYDKSPLKVTSESESGKDYQSAEQAIIAFYLIANGDSVKAVKQAYLDKKVRVVIRGKLELSVQEKI